MTSRALTVVAISLMVCCAPKSKPVEKVEWRIPEDKVVFIDHHIVTSGKVVSGDYSGAQIDMPTYSFDEKARALEGSMDFAVDGDLKVIYGDGESLTGAAGEGAGTALTGIFELPYRGEGYGTPGIEILGVDPDGTARIVYLTESITLKPGQKWSKSSSRIDTYEWGHRKGKARLTSRDTIINHGILDKSRVSKW